MLRVAALEDLANDVLGPITDHTHIDVVPGQSKVGARGTEMTVRVFNYEDNGSLYDIKEQGVVVVPAGADVMRLRAYFEGIALAVRRLGTEVRTLHPEDLFPVGAFAECRTADEFAARIPVVLEALPAGGLDDLEGSEPIAVNPELERAIEADPDNLATHLVYADWLSERGDPRGELIACWAATSDVARRRGADLIAEHRAYFTGKLVGSAMLEDVVRLEWQYGWISTAWLGISRYQWDAAPEPPRELIPSALRGLFGHPSSKFLRSLTLGSFRYGESLDFDELYRSFAPRPTLRRLFIGDTEREEHELSWTHAGDLAQLRGYFPRLEELQLRVGSVQLAGALEYPHLRSLMIHSGGTPATNVRAIGEASLPALETLELWFGDEYYGGNATLDDTAPLLLAERLPALTSLGLCNCAFTDELCGALVDAPVLQRLHTLDLSKGTLSDEGARVLLSHRAAFAQLRKLVVSESFLSPDAIAALGALGPAIVAEQQKQPRRGERYVSVGE